ncbi:uncharacterized protein PHALS_14364 [Plasmopara halstedii]|uniref:Uncharacterized protein n=1 Tax=Plasmopara halstedii TaxID=4781 RepID=A0A0P1AT11_PLAHL|nr:uncharacterized protein PHALS_14364 [Plasmopara halstedii]CEG44098.1 hypothetical protein PHALS_14364 [Plasmopara halstedii]|eukprot:XP_024580467.1 hypothetical protein PHALS_14364 [Plasmopara halstedii]
MEPSDATLSSPTFAARVSPGNIRTLILEKEKELHDINEYRIRTLEALLRDKEITTSAAKQKLSKLQEDFKYNLKLLEGRDEELALYDTNFANLKNVLRDREIELSESKVREAETQAELKQMKQKASDTEVIYQQKLKDARAQIEGARWKFDDALRHQEEAMESLRRKLERSMNEKEEEMDTLRRELTVTFDDSMRKREIEFQQTSEELKSHLREVELSNKALARDINVQRDKVEELTIKNENIQQLLRDKEKELKSIEWTSADVKAAKDVKIGELENEVARLNEVKQNLLDEYEKKMAELLQSLHAVEKAFVHQKKQYEEELQKEIGRKKFELNDSNFRYEAKIENLVGRLGESEKRVEALQAELKQAKWDADDRAMEKEREVDRVKSALHELEAEQNHVKNELQKQLRAQDREMQILQETLHESQRQIALLKDKDKTQRDELLEGIEKQEDLQRELRFVQERWEKRWEQQQQELDERHDLQIRELKQAKQRLVSQKEAVEKRLAQAEMETQRLCRELSTLQSSARTSESIGSQFVASKARHKGDAHHSSDSVPVAPSPLWSDDPGTFSPVPGMSPLLTDSPQIRGKSVAGTSANSLELENAKLRDIIRQMKESLAHQADKMEASPGHSSGSQTTSDLTAQLKETQERCVALETKLNENNKNGLNLQLESCKQEQLEAQRVIEAKNTQIAEFENQIQKLEEAQVAESNTQAAQVTDLKRKLEAANSDIDRLVRERSQLMELSNQLRADLRRIGSESGSKPSKNRMDSAGERDQESIIADLTQSLDEARIHNKTLKKELRRMVKAHVQLQEGREIDDRGTKIKESEHIPADPEKRRSSTLSMMKALNSGSSRPKPQASTTIRLVLDRVNDEVTKKKGSDEEVQGPVQNKRSSTQSQIAEACDKPLSNSDHETESNVKASNSTGNDNEGRFLENEHQSSKRKNIIEGQRGSEKDIVMIGRSSSKVTDARLKLQQAKEMLLLSGKRAPVAGSRSTSTTLSAATRLSDRETNSQRSAVKKLQQMQSKRAEMATERKNVRNYNLA